MTVAWHRSIKKRLSLIILSVAMITGFMGYSAFVSWNLLKQQQQTQEYAAILAQILSKDFAELILLDDIQVAADINAKLGSFELLQAAVIHGRNGVAVFQYQASNSSLEVAPLPPPDQRQIQRANNHLHLYQDLYFGEAPLGTAWLSFQTQSLAQRLEQDAPALFLIALSMLVFSYALASALASYFTTPILQLVRFFEQTQQLADIQTRPQWRENNEFGRVYDEVNKMLDRIQSAHEAQKIAAAAFEIPTGMVITDANQKILQVNQAFTNITGYLPQEVIGKNPTLLQSGRHHPDFYQNMWQSLLKHQRWEGEIWNRHKSGEVYPERLTIQAVMNSDKQVAYYVGAFLDLSELKKAEAKAEYLGLYDPLTGLANRQLLLHRLEETLQALKIKTKTGSHAALFCFDLDNFKLINDSYGHDAGDRILVTIAKRLRSYWGESAQFARLSGDVFLVLDEKLDIHLPQATLQAEEKAKYLLDFLGQPHEVAGKALRCPARVGITLFTDSCKDPSELVKQAEVALHQAKQQTHDLCFFDPAAEQLVQRYFETQLALEKALSNQAFELHYQVQCNEQGQTTGAEALLRWRDPVKGLIPPDQFIPIAERSRLIIPIGHWVLEEGCRQLSLWQKHPKTASWQLAINVSAVQFQQDNFVDQVIQCLTETRANPQKLKLELTEALMIADQEKTIEKMAQLQKMGLRISLDDFGTGFSSLSY